MLAFSSTAYPCVTNGIGEPQYKRANSYGDPLICPADAFVFFGATGDLAYKQIFPSLLGLVRDEGLNVPIIGVAKAGWGLDQLKARATDSLQHHDIADPKAMPKLLSLLRYVDGDYEDPSTFTTLRQTLGPAQRPAHYLAIPPSFFGLVVQQLGKSGCASGARSCGFQLSAV